ncbi:MAG: hypothetical protein RMJ84_01100 [Sandaracinaceae bacterium]|nr:hypothetical protein [Sandaracinaceae bacterium]
MAQDLLASLFEIRDDVFDNLPEHVPSSNNGLKFVPPIYFALELRASSLFSVIFALGDFLKTLVNSGLEFIGNFDFCEAVFMVGRNSDTIPQSLAMSSIETYWPKTSWVFRSSFSMGVPVKPIRRWAGITHVLRKALSGLAAICLIGHENDLRTIRKH